MNLFLEIKNRQSVQIPEIPVLEYQSFYSQVLDLLKNENNHCVNYFAFHNENKLKFICCIADDDQHTIHLLSHEMHASMPYPALDSLTAKYFPMHIYEREIHENFGIPFENHPWLKPVRYAFDRADRTQTMNNYPFFEITGGETHKVSVGPIHAGVIEPGHFLFSCTGEDVRHLEIHLGFQHRGIEKLFIEKKNLLQRTILAENIAGDTAVGHALAFVGNIESLGKVNVSAIVSIERTIALELERIAMHIFDMSNLCIGAAYQLGASVFGALRTPVINYFQWWCGNRFAKSLIRTGGSNYPLTDELAERFTKLLNDFEKTFEEMSERFFSLPSVLARFENIGTISKKQAESIGAVGLAARVCNVKRDVRSSHPFEYFSKIKHEPVLLDTGDIHARLLLRRMEIEQSISKIRMLLNEHQKIKTSENSKPVSELKLQANTLSISLVEAWRGEICHCAVTDSNGEIAYYKVKDPSMHNWFALALALRDLEISDFPINNKSFDLSYCGYDL